MAYFHCRSWIWNQIWTRIPNPVATLYYAEVFPLHGGQLGFRFGYLSHMVTVPILGMDLHPKDISLSLLHKFQSGDQSPNPNQWKNSA